MDQISTCVCLSFENQPYVYSPHLPQTETPTGEGGNQELTFTGHLARHRLGRTISGLSHAVPSTTARVD